MKRKVTGGYSNTAYSIGIIISGLIAFRLSEKFLASKWESILFSLIAMAIVTLTILFLPNAQMFLVFFSFSWYVIAAKRSS